MRPVNLLPKEERGGTGRASRTGPLPYVIVGVLALALAGVLALSLFNKQIGDREAEVQTLEAKAAETAARAESLSSFVSFQQVHDARVQTVDQLARSRFDWERILRELSLVLPRHVWLTSVTGTVAPGVSVEGQGTGLRDGIEGPALELVGCGRTHNDVARMVAAMRDIDGVTRVTASDSATAGGGEGGGGGGGGEGSDCRTKPTVAMFHLIAAFDAVPPPPDAGGAAPAPVAPPADGEQAADGAAGSSGSNGSGAAGEGASGDASAGADGGVAETESQNAAARNDAKRAGQRTEKARNLIPGG